MNYFLLFLVFPEVYDEDAEVPVLRGLLVVIIP